MFQRKSPVGWLPVPQELIFISFSISIFTFTLEESNNATCKDSPLAFLDWKAAEYCFLKDFPVSMCVGFCSCYPVSLAVHETSMTFGFEAGLQNENKLVDRSSEQKEKLGAT